MNISRNNNLWASLRNNEIEFLSIQKTFFPSALLLMVVQLTNFLARVNELSQRCIQISNLSNDVFARLLIHSG